METSTKAHLTKLTLDLNNKINGVKEVVSKFKESVDAKLDGFNGAPSLVHNDLQVEITSLKDQLGKCDTDEIKKDLNVMDQVIEDRFQCVDKKMEKLRTEIDNEHQLKLSMLGTKLIKLQNHISISINQLKRNICTQR